MRNLYLILAKSRVFGNVPTDKHDPDPLIDCWVSHGPCVINFQLFFFT